VTGAGLRRVALGIEYRGSAYAGWQAQRRGDLPTVQEVLETALSAVADEPVRTVCAGRTDTGVHASQQVVHFDTRATRPDKAWVLGGNSLLPADIGVNWACEVDTAFHARFSASFRRYRYLILNRPVRSALYADGVCLQRRPLDAPLMHSEAQCLLGEQDFSSFRAAGCQSRTPMRRIEHILVTRAGALVMIDVQANAFVHHMVRNIAGALIGVGSGARPRGWLAALLEARDRRLGAPTAPAAGLYLVDVGYAAHWSLPRTRPGPWFLEAMAGDS
jgi:tRNA pseudouridine38-40 synthase